MSEAERGRAGRDREDGLRVLVLDGARRSGFTPILLERLAGHQAEVATPGIGAGERLAWADVVVDVAGVFDRVEMVRNGGHLRLWQMLATGVDRLDLQECRRAGLPVANCPGRTGAVALAEHCLLGMLMLVRGHPEAASAAHGWDQSLHGELFGATLVVVGLGASGQALVVRAHALGMRVVGVARDVGRPGLAHLRNLAELRGLEDVDAVLGEADFLSLHLPSTSETRRIIDARRLGLLRPRARLVNVARGDLVDERALAAALASGHLAGAALDVFEAEPLPAGSPLWQMPNVLISPHVAGRTTGTARRRAVIAATNCDRVAAGVTPLYLVG